MTDLPEARILRLQPGDIVVVTLDYRLTEADLDGTRANLKEAFPNNEVVVVERGDVAITRPGGEP